MGKDSARKWYHWFSAEDTPEERRLILKLDVLIIPYAFVIYWVKYIDQTNISKPDRKTIRTILGVELTIKRQRLCIWNVDRPQLPWKPIGPIPDNFCGRKCAWAAPFRVSIPRSTNVLAGSVSGSLLGIFNLLQCRAPSYAEIMAYRFLVSIFEVSLNYQP
jgi:hypothetical protein